MAILIIVIIVFLLPSDGSCTTCGGSGYVQTGSQYRGPCPEPNGRHG